MFINNVWWRSASLDIESSTINLSFENEKGGVIAIAMPIGEALITATAIQEKIRDEYHTIPFFDTTFPGPPTQITARKPRSLVVTMRPMSPDAILVFDPQQLTQLAFQLSPQNVRELLKQLQAYTQSVYTKLPLN